MKPKPSPPATDIDGEQTVSEQMKKKKSLPPLKSIRILEIGGSMAPIWRQYFNDVKKLMYVVDTSNLCQISAAGYFLFKEVLEYVIKFENFRCFILFDFG